MSTIDYSEWGIPPAEAGGYVIVPAPAKINLFLHVLGRADDGYHALQSVFVLIALADRIGLRVRDDARISRINRLEGVTEDQDLSIRAARALQRASNTRKGVAIHGVKKIPMGAGLGGGSSDAATVLLALNVLWGLHYSRQELMAIGATLGADVPFFIFGETAWAEGRGEKLTALPLDLPDYAVIVPPVVVPTATIFGASTLRRDTPARQPVEFLAWFATHGQQSLPIDAGWHNDLQGVAEQLYPALAPVHDAWQAAWAQQYPSVPAPPLMMTGSGSGYFSPIAKTTAERTANAGRQIVLIPYNSPPFLPAKFWQGSALHRHPLWPCARD
jgi:4-diphosphocytidyl-2-C-methyl-D-erythritol kinase